MSTAPIVPTPPGGSTTPTSGSPLPNPQSLNNMFLQLLVAQLQNQSPLNPMDPTQFVGQLAQFSELSEVTSIYQLLQQSVGSGGAGSGSGAEVRQPAGARKSRGRARLLERQPPPLFPRLRHLPCQRRPTSYHRLYPRLPAKSKECSKMPNFSIPLSGLTSESAALSTVANNLANQNTTGYKDKVALFSDLFYQSLGTTGAGDPIQVGAGTQVSSLPSLFTQGSVSATGVPTDVAIQGTGFFAVQSSSGVIDYTRAGAFSVDANNFLVTSGGQQVLGYPAANGVVNTGAGIAPLQLGAGTISPPTATGNVQLTANLNAAAAVGDTFSTPVTIYDSLVQPGRSGFRSASDRRRRTDWSIGDGHSDFQWEWSADGYNCADSRSSELHGDRKRNHVWSDWGRGERGRDYHDDSGGRDSLFCQRFGFRRAGDSHGWNSLQLRPDRFYDCGGIDAFRSRRRFHGDDSARDSRRDSADCDHQSCRRRL